jgi:hypothetical protein
MKTVCMPGISLKITFLLFTAGFFLSCQSQTSKHNDPKPARKDLAGMAAAANEFLNTLSEKQKDKIYFDFDANERYNWHFIPKNRKGIPLGELNKTQEEAAMNLLRTALSDTGFQKTTAIIQLEDILREAEGRSVGDDYRDDGKYFFTIFGNPASDTIWGWRLEGHHISFNFSAKNNLLISGTPGFLGTNPAIVLSGPQKGKYILKDETGLAFALLSSFTETQKQKAVINNDAPSDILTSASRKAMISDERGILYSEMNNDQQKIFLQLLGIYIHRYTRLFADEMMKDIENAGLHHLRFAWAGDLQTGIGHPHYYRIVGPTIIIEYDNTQNNANHIHTVIRDLKNDFGEDELQKHYKEAHSHR